MFWGIGSATYMIKKIDVFFGRLNFTNSQIQKIIKNTVLILYAYAMQFSIVLKKGFQKKIYLPWLCQKTKNLWSRYLKQYMTAKVSAQKYIGTIPHDSCQLLKWPQAQGDCLTKFIIFKLNTSSVPSVLWFNLSRNEETQG